MICTSLSLRLPLFEIGIGNTYIYNSASPNFHIPLVFPWAESFWPKKINIFEVHFFALYHAGQILRQYERGIGYVGVQNHRSWIETTRWEEIRSLGYLPLQLKQGTMQAYRIYAHQNDVDFFQPSIKDNLSLRCHIVVQCTHSTSLSPAASARCATSGSPGVWPRWSVLLRHQGPELCTEFCRDIQELEQLRALYQCDKVQEFKGKDSDLLFHCFSVILK